MLLQILRGYWQHILVGLAAAALTAFLYQPRLDAARAERNEARTLAETQSAAIEALEADVKARREAARKALEEQRRRTERLAADNARLREEIARRTYKDEPCEDAAAALREQWLSR